MAQCDGGADKGGGIRAGGANFLPMGIIALMDNDGRHRPTAATGPRPCKKCIQQSNIIICEGSTLLKLLYTTMVITNLMAYLVTTNQRIIAPDHNSM
jgi:hypothetical protein